ncbi:murein L,D-transpeptidase catalytic domain family protein [Flavobacterium psychrophilum]|uniref:Murein L,D-transpeptidase catalytic domain family protein n=1 Tax=Flavobacterium psychrophilum TaxID=96345 RepID=A0A7U2NGU1_FLAPS|nr:murein L,D-transpeptidase catalytic domain family protein [Flavobacterium psychrophilum]EKT4550790.1 murein L,D-transpeptidase catalytic domain family protein [Flavobacterium psychrophilum]ELM3645177.1 murein L,D-transpeptidase catalytic domain family protein [Flavobacterium psychrophilum]OJH11773.1 hypothetical protein FPG87_12655 [Flavobacterium psychrophilum]OUD24373.1 hypothetical protein FPG92_12665 [Flavobacterium psychrophilum]QRE04768.1 murein L,D-transpeptidase catalytic domain fam
MRKIILLIFAIGIVFTIFALSNRTDKLIVTSELNSSTKEKIENEIIEVQKLVKKDSQYNSEIGFFIDMKIQSGKNRFFIYNFRTKKIIDKGLVAHGSGSETGIAGRLKFSNIDNSLATSIGKYSIGNSYNGRFGKAYKLYGLDKTNSNAFNRNVVLHKYFDVPYDEQDESICNSYGCPMVNEKFYKRIEKIIDNSEKNIIMSIYY